MSEAESVEVSSYGEEGEEVATAVADEPVEEATEVVATKPAKVTKFKGKKPSTLSPEAIKVDVTRNVSRWDADRQEPDFQLGYKMFRFGNLTPVKIRWIDGEWFLNDGFRRHAAAILIREGFKWVDMDNGKPVNVHDPDFELNVTVLSEMSDKEAADINISENDDRKELSEMDRAAQIRYYESVGVLGKDIAFKLHISHGYVSQLRKLNSYSRKLQDRIHKDRIPIRAAIALASATPETQKEILDKAEREKAAGKPGKITHTAVAAALREDKAAGKGGSAPGRPAKTISMTSGDIRKYLETHTIPGTDPAIIKFATAFMNFIRGDDGMTVKRMDNAFVAILKATPTARAAITKA